MITSELDQRKQSHSQPQKREHERPSKIVECRRRLTSAFRSPTEKFVLMGWSRAVEILLLCMVCVPGAWSAANDFLHLDCGASKIYTDTYGITWRPDNDFVSTGNIWPNVNSTFEQSFKTLRYFSTTSRAKNCFTLPVKPYGFYILRAGFFHGSYDNSVSQTSFQLVLDATIFEAVSIANVTKVAIHEVMFQAWNRNSTSLCLVQDSSGTTPFISNIALRPIEEPMISESIRKQLANNQTVTTQTRFYLAGSKAKDSYIRYPDDPYDRYWYGSYKVATENDYPMRNASLVSFTSPPQGQIAPKNAIVRTDLAPGLEYLNSTPVMVLGNALTTNGNLTISLNPSTNLKAHVQYYFVELNSTVNSTDRGFYLLPPGGDPILITTKEPLTLYSVQNFTTIGPGSKIVCYPDPLRKSPKVPMMSALEIFKVNDPRVSLTNDRDWAAIESIETDMNLTSWRGDPCLPHPHEWINCNSVIATQNPAVLRVMLSASNLSGGISPSFNDLEDLTSLELDGNFLTGQLPDLSALTKLKQLHLQNNKLSGPLPDWLASLPNLRELFLHNNNFSGSIPSSFSSKNWNFTFNGNPLLIVTTRESPSKIIVAIICGVVAIVAFIALLALGCYWFLRRDRSHKECNTSLLVQNSYSDFAVKKDMMDPTSNVHGGARKFSLQEILDATDNYGKVIGRGGFGLVYYGRLTDGREVAVKVLNKESQQGESEFLNEIDILSRVHHKNLVNLVGYCRVPGMQMILIYDYMQKGSLRDYLSGDDAKSKLDVLDWKTRLNIALHAAQGLEYLHNRCSPSLIHRDVKSSNILITSEYEGKLTDFGLSRLVGEKEEAQYGTFVKGTALYLDPAYYSANPLSTKSDVFSFGVVLLELITGRPADYRPDKRSINDWARESLIQGSIDAILDPAVRASHQSEDSLWKVAELALQCVEPKREHRPQIDEVLLELTGAIALEAAVSNDHVHVSLGHVRSGSG